MYSEVRQRTERLVASLNPSVLAARKIGLEKESLRVSAAGGISQTDHPQSLGAALTHPSITTDFSEALLEMVTPPCDSAAQALDYLTVIHQFIAARLPENEHIWNTSMPCILRGGESVRIGEYGTSHSGRMKHAYRRGLGLRYGRRMQAIAGVHFNFSMPENAWSLRRALLAGDPLASSADYASTGDSVSSEQSIKERTDGYFQMMQNLMRIGWVVPYLFGASPAICSTFLAPGEGDEFDVWNQSTRYAPYGTSLRMGKIGYRYREDEPIDLSVRHTSIEAYIEDIIAHVSTVHPPYEKLGIKDEQGDYQQLSAARLQIENEYYSTVRPKQIPESGELPIYALKQRGIRYLELRSVDVNLFDPVGVNLEQIAMLEMLMMFAWLATPEPLSAEEMDINKDNVNCVAHRGREPGLQLQKLDGAVPLTDWGQEILDAIEPIAAWLDSQQDKPLYVPALQSQRAKFEDAELTPSAKMIAGIKSCGSFFEHAQMHSLEHDKWLKENTHNAALHEKLANLVEESRRKQVELEASSTCVFDDFIANYLGQIHSNSTSL
ncbi:MAG: glutamate--cysteine ligase [Granulosicoccus sp.]